MQEQLNKFITSSIVTSIILTILGIVISIFPAETISVFTYGSGALMLLYGIYLLVTGRRNTFNPFDFSFLGVALVVFGIISFMNPDRIASFLPTILGIWFISTSISKLKLSISLRPMNRTLFITTLILSFVSIIIGIYFVTSPMAATEQLMVILGILLAVYAVSDLIDMIIFKKHLKDLLAQFDGVEVIKSAKLKSKN